MNFQRIVKRKLVLVIFLFLISGSVLAGQTIIQKGNIITDVFSATSLSVERISGYLLKGDIDASGNLVKNLAEPANPQDAATKAYVDDVAKKCSAIPPEARGAVFQTGKGGRDAAVDSEGNVYVVSTAQECIQDPYGYGQCTGYRTVCYLTKMKSNLQKIWEEKVQGCGTYSARLLFDNLGRVVIAGSSVYRIDQNGKNGRRLPVSISEQYAAGGNAPPSLAIDLDGNIYSVYHTSPSERSWWAGEDQYYHFYLVKLNSSGDEIWKKEIYSVYAAGGSVAAGEAVLLSPDGSVIAIGSGYYSQQSTIAVSASIKKFDPDGNLLKSGSVSIGEGAWLSDAEIDEQGNLYISAGGGYKKSSMVKVDGSTLKKLWSKKTGVMGSQLAPDGSGGVYVASGTGSSTNYGYTVTLYNTDGKIVWSRGGGDGLVLDVETQSDAVIVLSEGWTSCQGVIGVIPCYPNTYYTLERRLP
jgi:sugar lactone lactonase YvrE